MRSSFFGIGVAQQGLFSSRGNMDVINHNISNSKVEGYSRQYAIQQASRPLRNLHRGMVGTGSEILTVDQYRSGYLDSKYRNFNKDLGEYSSKEEFLKQMESIFNEPYSNGLSTYLDRLYTGMQTLTTAPNEDAARTNVVQLMKGFCDAVNDTSKKLRVLQNDVNFEIKSTVDQINSYAEQIAALNQQIQDSEISGHKANDLRDQRNRLMDKLSEIVPVSSREDVDALGQKTFHVSINGAQLVHGPIASYLEVRARQYLNNPEDNTGLFDVYWKTGQQLNVSANSFAGKLKGLADLRDGVNNRNFRGLVDSVPGAMDLTVKNVKRFDLPRVGKLTINGQEIEYEDYEVNEATKEIKFQLKNPAPAGLHGKYSIMGEDRAFRGIPYYVGRLNELSRIYAQKMNDLHQKGRDNTGVPLFVGEGNYAGKVAVTTAGTVTNLKVYSEEAGEVTGKGKLTIHGQDVEYTAASAATLVTLPDGSQKYERTFTLAAALPGTDSRMQEGATVRLQNINSDNLTVNPEIAEDLQKLELHYTKKAVGDVSDTALLHDMISLRQNTKFFDRGTPDNFVQAYMGEMGIDKSQATSFRESSKDLLRMVEIHRMSVSGVNQDEEISDMMAYMRVYQYSAKAMSVFDQIYETTINIGR